MLNHGPIDDDDDDGDIPAENHIDNSIRVAVRNSFR